MIVTTISENKIRSITLPEKAKGQFWLYEEVEDDNHVLASVEAVDNSWVLKSNRNVKIIDRNKNEVKSVSLTHMSIYALRNKNDAEVFVFTEPITENRQIFEKFLIRGDTDITIGRADTNDICYHNNVVSSNHAMLFFRNGKWYVQDMNSTNGTFVNEFRINKKELHFGDIVFIMGLKIVIGKNLIAINNPDNQVVVSNKLLRFVNQEPEINGEDDYELKQQEYFYRSPRFKRDIKTAVFKVDSPPASLISEEMPWMLIMGSSMAMGMMSVVTLITAITTNNITSMVMGGSMLMGTLLFPTLTKRYEKKRKIKKETYRKKKYREYLNSIAVKISEECNLQTEILNENCTPIQECENRIIQKKRNLWERGLGQNDFLQVRLGHGTGVLDADIKYSERKFVLEDDGLEEELLTLCEKTNYLQNVPITYSLLDNKISGVIGKREQVIEFAKGMVIQLAALYSYDEVKFVFIYDENELDISFVKWLPHVWNEDKKFRFIATNANEIKEVSAFLEPEIDRRISLNDNEIEDKINNYYVVFSFSKLLAERSEALKRILATKNNIYFSLVTFYNELKDLPKECSMVVEVKNGKGRLYDKNDISGKNIEFIPDIKLTHNPFELSVSLANTLLNDSLENYKFPNVITFMELFGVGDVEHLNVLSRWAENDPTMSLGADVGFDTYGEVFKLDLHEKFHGPHGLIAGMTGSGKSEFIITYILSLAVNYHPNEVAFILIDYKGGGMAKSFEKLPHVAGIITNLDGSSIKRSLVSIESELKRRQKVFADVSKLVGVSNIDIYKYQKYYREGIVDEPLQHLFIVSDEFAELKTQQPEFMAQLVSAARIGRSLGIHLILATQKPSGVVDDQIWSNSRFHICLKVQERADSMDMLKRPDAAELTDTGRFYLQVGYNEMFELGQSAWAGAPYYRSDKVIKEKDNDVVIIDNNGHKIKTVGLDKNRSIIGTAPKQLDAITKYICDIANEEGIKVRPLWLQPIPDVILIEKIKEKYHSDIQHFYLNPIIGEYDDPAHQQQCALTVPISSEGNVLVYGVAGSGKTSFINALIYSLIQDHSPDEINIYILDFASETLRAFSKAPHVGDVILSYESEKINNLLKMLKQEIEKRKKMFSDYGGDYSSYIKESRQSLPSIIVAINNFAALCESYDNVSDIISYLSREGTKYGIYFVVTALGTGDVRFRLAQNFKQVFVLQFNDDADYSTVLGKTDGLFPCKFKGRGLFKKDEIYEFQIARLTQDEVQFSFIQSYCKKACEEWNGETAKKVPILPDKVNEDFLKDYINDKHELNIPIGVEKNSLEVHFYPFGALYINMILSAGDEYKSFTADLVSLAGMFDNIQGMVFDLPNVMGRVSKSLPIYSTVKDCEEQISKLYDIVLYRNNTYKEAIENGKPIEKFDKMIVVINSITSLTSSLSDIGNEKLSLILLKGAINYGINIIISEQSKNLSSFSYEKWYKTNVSSADGIWIGNGITEQYQMKANRNTAEMLEDIGSEFGFSLIKGKSFKLKILKNANEGEYDEYEQ